MSIGDNLADYLHNNKVNNIIFMDKSARLGYFVLKNSWKKKYPDFKLPNMYFTNPRGYSPTLDRPTRKIADEFNNIYKSLSENKNSSILLFDVCLHSGNAIRLILKTMKIAGYTDVRVGLVQPQYGAHDISIDFLASDTAPIGRCRPFGTGGLVVTNNTSVLSSGYVSSDNDKPTQELRQAERQVENNYTLMLRKEIKSMYEHGLLYSEAKDEYVLEDIFSSEDE